MKLLVVAPYFYPKVGGLENYAWHICKGLKETYGWEIVSVASNHEENEYKEEIIQGIKIYRLPYWFKLSNTPINFSWFIDIFKIIKNEKPTIINAHTPVPFIADVAAIVSYFRKVPFVLTYQNDLVKKNILDIIFKIYYATLGKLTFNLSMKIIVSSQYYADKSENLTKYHNKIKVIPPGVYIRKQTDNVKKISNSVLFVGQLDKTHIHKGLFYLIDAISIVSKEIPKVNLVIVGDGNYINEYKKYSRSLTLQNNIQFKGFIDDTELSKIYAAVDLVTLPSFSHSEGFGMVLIEAAAHGKPVIGTKVGGIPSIIKDKFNGYLVPPENSELLAKKIIEILQDSKLATKLGANGFRMVSNEFTWKVQVEKTHKLFMSI